MPRDHTGGRAQVTGTVERERLATTVSGNIEAGKGRAEEDYLQEIVSLFMKAQDRVRALRSAAEQLDEYVKD